MDEVVRLNCLVAGLVITVGVYIQTLKVFQTKSAKDFALLLVVALLYNELAWLWYGLVIGEWPIVALCAINIPADIGIAIGWVLYGRGRRTDHGNDRASETAHERTGT